MAPFKSYPVITGLIKLKRHQKFHSLLYKELGIDGGIEEKEGLKIFKSFHLCGVL
jgi:hypothetical protein